MAAVVKQLCGAVPEEYSGERVDKVLARLFPDYSRTLLQKWLRDGLVLVDDEIPLQRDRVAGGEQVELAVPEMAPLVWAPQPIPLDIRYQDSHLLVINKPAGLVVHPGAGNADGTLLNGLLHYDSALRHLPRAGIVHRLDKDTTGLMVVARGEAARQSLIRQLADRSLARVYLAVVRGAVVAGGTVDEPIGRDPHDRRRMAVSSGGKPAVTEYRVEERYRHHTLLRLQLRTGRTHQIRVHLRHIGYPLVGDPVYGGGLKMPKDAGPALREVLREFRRQALHATEIRLRHPVSGELLHWRQPLPADLQRLTEVLRDDARAGAPQPG